MKKSILTIFLLIIVTIGISAQEFHPYKIKSGKITFEKRKYSMHAKLHIDSDGKISGSSTNPSYVEEEITYYWDNYGGVNYSTKKKNGKLKRFEPDREKIAIKIDTVTKIDASVFTPKWLK